MKRILFIIMCSIFVFPASSFAYFNGSGTNENVYYDFGQAFDNVTSVTIRSSGSIAVSLLNVQNSTIWSESVPVSSTLKDTTYTFNPAINNVKVFSAFLTNSSSVTNVSIFNGSTLLKSSGDNFTKTKPTPTTPPTPAPTFTPYDGLLSGHPLTLSADVQQAGTNSNLVTDGNLESRELLTANGTATDTVWYEFSSSVNLTAFKYKVSANGLMVRFYDNSMKRIDDLLMNPDNNNKNLDLNLSNVKAVSVMNITSGTLGLYEWDVFGSETPLPTPTPSPRPTVSPTPTPSSTATPVPTTTPSPTPTATPEATPSPTPTPALKPTLDVSIAPEKIGLGKEFTADISLKNVKNIYAEDFEVKYDKEHLQYLGFEEVTGYKVYNKPVDQNGAIRFVVASQGEEYGINKDTVVVKLKFKAKAKGTAVVDATKARIADTEEEYDLETDNCLEDSIIIEATDVNKSGTFTLVDLAIDARYFKYFAPDVDPIKYNAQQAGDEYVNDDDLLFIVDQILNNPDYLPNTN